MRLISFGRNLVNFCPSSSHWHLSSLLFPSLQWVLGLISMVNESQSLRESEKECSSRETLPTLSPTLSGVPNTLPLFLCVFVLLVTWTCHCLKELMSHKHLCEFKGVKKTWVSSARHKESTGFEQWRCACFLLLNVLVMHNIMQGCLTSCTVLKWSRAVLEQSGFLSAWLPLQNYRWHTALLSIGSPDGGKAEPRESVQGVCVWEYVCLWSVRGRNSQEDHCEIGALRVTDHVFLGKAVSIPTPQVRKQVISEPFMLLFQPSGPFILRGNNRAVDIFMNRSLENLW